jgi:hypothetical protein
VLHALPCKRETALGSVNVVHRCEGWKTPEDSWMELEAAEEEAFFVNVLMGDEEQMEESESIDGEEEEESIRLEQGLGSQMKERKNTRQRSTEEKRGSELGGS